MDALLPDDALVAVLHYFAEAGKSRFTADRQRLHEAFYELRQEHPDALASVGFRRRCFFPESSALDQALMNLEATGLLERQNLEPRWYSVKQVEVQEAFGRYVRREIDRAGIELAEFEKLAADFSRRVASP
jgi:hypothetical protein